MRGDFWRSATLLALLGSGCVPLVVAYPPPSPAPTSMDPVPRGEVELGLGGAALTDFLTQPEGTSLNPFGGTLMGHAGVGLSDRVDLSLVGARTFQGPTGGLQAGVLLWESERLRVDGLAGVGVSAASDTYGDRVYTLDEDGQPVEDADGEPLYEVVETDYAYLSAAPGLGARARLRANDRLSFPFMLRTSYAFTVARYGLEGMDMPHYPWVELGSGVVFTPRPGADLGLGASLYAYPLGLALGPNVMASASVRPRELLR